MYDFEVGLSHYKPTVPSKCSVSGQPLNFQSWCVRTLAQGMPTQPSHYVKSVMLCLPFPLWGGWRCYPDKSGLWLVSLSSCELIQEWVYGICSCIQRQSRETGKTDAGLADT